MNAQSFIDAGLHYTPHSFTVPLDYQDASKGTIEVFARAVCLVGDEESTKLGWFTFRAGLAFLLHVKTAITAG